MSSSIMFGPLHQVDAGVLNVGYVDAGPAGGPAVLLPHGWPVGHDLPQEAPEAFARAVLDVGDRVT